MNIKTIFITGFCLFFGAIPVANAQTTWIFSNTDLKVRIIARTQDQMAAFYEARGFPKNAIERLKQFCFFTVSIKNKSDNDILHDLEKWIFTSSDKSLKRIQRNTLIEYWQNSGLEKRLISTFRWTLLPEKLDFQSQENEGGNIVISRSRELFNIQAVFSKGNNKMNKIINMKINGMQCADNVK